MEILIIIVALLLVGGVSSALHGIIKPAVDWLSPEPSVRDFEIDTSLVDSTQAQQASPIQKSKPSRRAMRDEGLSFQRALARQYARGAEKRRLRADIAEHERRPKTSRYLP